MIKAVRNYVTFLLQLFIEFVLDLLLHLFLSDHIYDHKSAMREPRHGLLQIFLRQSPKLGQIQDGRKKTTSPCPRWRIIDLTHLDNHLWIRPFENQSSFEYVHEKLISESG